MSRWRLLLVGLAVAATAVQLVPAASSAATRHYITRQASYSEYGYDYPGDLLYTVTLIAEFWYDGTAADVVYEHPQCEGSGGFKQWSCDAPKSGSQWDPGRYGGAMTAWADFTTEWHYPCPWCSEVDHAYVRLWLSPTGEFHSYAGR